jgi:hypothetical protein
MTPVIYAGVWNGHVHSGEISAREVDEFVEACKAAGWSSVAIAADCHIIRKWRRA